jgi:hypothetical protein
VNDVGNRGLPHLLAKVIDERTHPVQDDAVGWRFEQIIWIELFQKAEPAPPGSADDFSGPLHGA